MQNYYCDEEMILQIKNDLSMVKEQLMTQHQIAESLQYKIESGDEWEGEANKIMAAYMDLVVQYHAKLAGVDKADPLQESVDALDAFLQVSEDFYDSWTLFQEMENI